MGDTNERIVWLDVETNGLDPHSGNVLLQVAAIVTDASLEEVGNPYEAKVYHTVDEAQRVREASVPYVQEMHAKTDLWTKITTEGVNLNRIDEDLSAHLISLGVEVGKSRLGGNSITLDRNFCQKFLPKTFAVLGYRSYDMSSVAGFLGNLVFDQVPAYEKKLTHEALEDIRESIAEAAHYRDWIRGRLFREAATTPMSAAARYTANGEVITPCCESVVSREDWDLTVRVGTCAACGTELD